MGGIEATLISFALGDFVVPSQVMPHLNRFGLQFGIGSDSGYVISFELTQVVATAERPIGIATSAGYVAAIIVDSMIRAGESSAHIMELTVPTLACVIALQPESMKDGSAAIAVGLETSVRMAGALQEVTNEKWWDANATAGGIGASLASARLMGMSEQEAAHSLALSVLQAPRFSSEADSALRRLLVVQTASQTIEAVLAARSGIAGPKDPLSGTRGLFAVLASAGPGDGLSEGLGKTWQMAEILRSAIGQQSTQPE